MDIAAKYMCIYKHRNTETHLQTYIYTYFYTYIENCDFRPILPIPTRHHRVLLASPLPRSYPRPSSEKPLPTALNMFASLLSVRSATTLPASLHTSPPCSGHLPPFKIPNPRPMASCRLASGLFDKRRMPIINIS